MRQKVSHQDIVKALQNSAHEYGVELLAEKIRKGTRTLYAELNPYQYPDPEEGGKAQHKLGLQDAMLIMETTGDYEPLYLMCAAHGFILQPADCEPVMAVVAYQSLADVMREVGEFAGELQASLADNALSHAERVALAREAQDIVDTLTPFLTLK